MGQPFYVTRTARALELVAMSPLTSSALAADLRVDARTARRLLGRLAADGMVRQLNGRTRHYVAGPRLLALAAQLLEDAGEPPSTLSAHGPGLPRTA